LKRIEPDQLDTSEQFGLASFELYRRNAASCVVATLGVVDQLDVIEDISPSILTGWVNLSASSLALEQLEETFSDKVVMPVAPAAGHSRLKSLLPAPSQNGRITQPPLIGKDVGDVRGPGLIWPPG